MDSHPGFRATTSGRRTPLPKQSNPGRRYSGALSDQLSQRRGLTAAAKNGHAKVHTLCKLLYRLVEGCESATKSCRAPLIVVRFGRSNIDADLKNNFRNVTAQLEDKTMQSLRMILILAPLTLIGACGDSEPVETPPQEPSNVEFEELWAKEIQPTIDQEIAKVEARSAIRYPCTLFSKEEASELLKSEVEAPSYAFENRSLNADSWQAEACTWHRSVEGPNLSIWVSKPDHFADGRVSCYGISEADVPETLLNGQALWTFRKRYGWAELLVCREDALFHVEIHDGPADESAAREIALTIAGQIASAL